VGGRGQGGEAFISLTSHFAHEGKKVRKGKYPVTAKGDWGGKNPRTNHTLQKSRKKNRRELGEGKKNNSIRIMSGIR